ncbi:aminopeptidase P family protein [Celeribacter neptunius]|uniref:Xaa-Pro aminopeptidase n=1 Tax=Celeribacter neptunius TaxID=588602 RepID=A0A1I3THD8_9RHOB|nr:aminopeptidase P family protein [Celeribacter neptunius]SFJ69036.1 Xaa-Pro aminopeptidase [Celeribacter neptunius]
MTPANRLAALRGWMTDHGLSACLVTSADAHQSEDCPERDRCLAWLSGFSGSLGRALVTAERAILFVDGRYQVQAARQVDPTLWQIAHLHDAPPEAVLRSFSEPLQVGYDPMLWTVLQVQDLADAIAPAGHGLVALAADPFSDIWPDRPAAPKGALRQMPNDVAGESGAHKRARVRQHLREQGLAGWVVTRPDDIAWLTNTRGRDIPMHPVPLSFAILPVEGPMVWAISEEKLTLGQVTPDPDIEITPPERFLARLAQIAKGKILGHDPNFAPQAVEAAIAGAGGTAVRRDDPVTALKAAKNAVELAGYRDAHVKDGVAWTAFMTWLAKAVPAQFEAGDPVTECEAADEILRLRRQQDGFLEASFNSISAAGSNAAMCHYAPKRAENVPITPDALYLLDSGGQYVNGTTDATRTIAFAPVSEDIRRIATAVLKGFIVLSSARFPEGSFPHHLDALARAPLWQMGLDYDHGTGHGVGHNLLVHEHPHRFGKRANPYPLLPGHIMTIEPGYYLEGQFGLRIENQVEVIADPDTPGFCRFAPLTMAPIPLALFDVGALTDQERGWLDDYHAQVRARLLPRLPEPARDWMMAQTAPCAG